MRKQRKSRESKRPLTNLATFEEKEKRLGREKWEVKGEKEVLGKHERGVGTADPSVHSSSRVVSLPCLKTPH